MNLLGPRVRTLELHPPPLDRLFYRSPSSEFMGPGCAGIPLLPAAIADAASLGYHCLRFAGHEPLHFPALHPLSREAHLNGMNVLLEVAQGDLTERLVGELRGSIDLLGVTLDGRPAVQGRVRRSHRLRIARDAGMTLAVIFRLTRGNLNDLEWAAHFALEHQAAALWVRVAGVTENQLAKAWMIVQSLRGLSPDGLTVEFETPTRFCDPLTLPSILEWQNDLALRPEALCKGVSPLVIDGEGVLRPHSDRFHERFAFGDLKHSSLRNLAIQWIQRNSAAYARAYIRAATLARTGSHHFSRFFDLLSEEAGRISPAAFTAAG